MVGDVAALDDTVTTRQVALEARALTKVFRSRRGTVTALRDVHVVVPGGSIVGLVGPNGAGKTTLMRCWVGFEQPTAGKALVNGRAVASSSPDDWVAFLPQQTRLYRNLSADEHLALARALRRGFAAEAAASYLDKRGIDRRRPIGQLSGGQQAQVAIALALHAGATTILLDEPLASLDPLQRAHLLQDLQTIRTPTTTIVVSSHIVSDLETVVDQLVLLVNGRVVLTGSVDGILVRHRAVDAATASDLQDVIGPIPSPTGTPTILCLARDPDFAPGRQASLTDIVLAYLAAAYSGPTS